MELKVLCDCGQKFAFDVEPINGRMPSAINCPACNEDATGKANSLIAENLASGGPITIPPKPPVSAPGGLRIVHAESPAPISPPPTLAATANVSVPPPIGAVKPISTDKSAKIKTEEFSLVRGIIGAVVGSLVGCALLFGFWLGTHIRFPFMGIATGATAGYLARWLARGTDTTLGVITAVIAGAAVTGTFVLMYGEFALFNILSIVICAGCAYRIAAD